jgi:hypothetical protein
MNRRPTSFWLSEETFLKIDAIRFENGLESMRQCVAYSVNETFKRLSRETQKTVSEKIRDNKNASS